MGKRRRHENRPSSRNEPADRAQSLRLPAPHALLSALALFLLIAGARWWFIGRYATDVPWLDQWDAEAQGLYQPWHAGTLDLHHWFAPHNEHRIFFTRALSLALLSLNRQWDPRLQMVTNAKLYALLAAALFLLLRRGRGPAFQVFCWISLAALGCTPYGATNTLLGFQSQFYFLAAFSLLSIYFLVNSRPGSLSWTAGALCGAAALFSMGSGYAAPLAALAVLLCSSLRSTKLFSQQLMRNWMTLLAACLLTGAGLLLRSSPPDSASLAAKSAADFGRFLLACLSWPGSPMLLLALVSWLPFAAFLGFYLRGSTRDDPAGRFILGIGFWVLLQGLALSIYRANSGEGLESRYTDILAFGLLANAVCTVLLLETQAPFRRWMPALAVVWFAVGAIGLYTAGANVAGLSWKHDMEFRRAAAAGFLATGDPRYLGQAPPHPDTARVASLLTDPALRPLLPAGIRSSLALSPRNGSPAPQMLNGLSIPDFNSVPPGTWTFSGMFSRFALIQPSSPFEYRFEKPGSLPFLLLYLVGDRYEIAAADSRQSHRILPLPADREGQGHHAFVYCPAGECVLRGSSGPSQLAIMEPKEIGLLSIAALLAVLWGHLVAAAGAVLFLALLLVPMARARKPAAASTAHA
jgi:hypothetical protein